MAIIINPDGTVSTIETTHDQYGNLRPKIDSEVMKEQEIQYNKNTISETKEKKSYVYPTYSTTSKKHKHKVKISRPIPPKKQRLLISRDEIEMFFVDRIASGKYVDIDEYERIKNSLSDDLKSYFASEYHHYLGWAKPDKKKSKKRNTFKKPKEPKAVVNKKHEVREKQAVKNNHNSHSGYSIGEIAKLGFLKDNYASSSDYEVRTSNPPRPARAPKYAYARDRFGRVQERDSFNEEKRNEFHVAQNMQRNYDYSSYDSNDDNDGAYRDWE